MTPSTLRSCFNYALALPLICLLAPTVLADHGGGSHINVNLSVPATSSTGNYTVTWDNNADPNVDEIQYLEEKPPFGSYASVYSGYNGSVSFSGKADGEYTYRVRHEACFGFFCSDQYSAPQSITVGATEPPGVPGPITGPLTAPDDTGYTLSWTGASGTVDYYELQRYIAVNWVTVQSTLSLSYPETGRNPGHIDYRVRACNSAGCGAFTSTKLVVVMEDNVTAAPSVQTADAVGTPPYDIDVDSAGNATVSVPIQLVPGVAGFAPGLSVEYNSGRGVERLEQSLPEDSVGYGWRLDGISRLRRCVVDQPSSASIQLNNNDSLCLNGMPLVLTSGTHFSVGAVYRTAIESFVRIEAKDNNGALWFEAKLPDGTAQEYGKNFDSRVSEDGETVYQWSISAEVDAHGNVVNYSYFTDADKGINYITNIHYSDAEVDFEYRSRTDADPVSIGSVSQHQNVFLHTVRVKYNGNNVREYRLLDQLVSGNRRLNQVQLCGFDEGGGNISCLNPLDFDWRTPASTMPGVEILVDGMTDGLSAVNLVEYGTITGSSHSFLFTERPFGNGSPPSNTQLLSGSGALRHVATKLRRDNGLGGFHDTTFAYQNVGLESTRNWGFLGFYASRAIDQQSGVASYTQYRMDFPHFGRTARVREYDGIYPSYATVVSDRAHDYAKQQINYSQGSTTYPYVSNVVEFHHEDTTLLGAGQRQHALTFSNGFIDRFVSTTQTGTGVTINPDQSTWGDVVPISLTGILGTAEKTVDFTNRTAGGKWLIGFADNLRTESWQGPPSGSGIVQEVEMMPHPTSLNIDKVTRYPTHATLTLVRDYSYDGQGRRTSTTISGDNVSSRTTTVNSFADDRYPSHTTNDLGHDINFSDYDVRFGTIETRGDPNGRNKSWSRDPFGRVISTTNADGIAIETHYSECSGSCSTAYGVSPAFKVQTTTTRSGVHVAPVQNAYYDVLGREIRTEVKSFDGTKFSKKDTKYDALGRVEKQSLPYFSGSPHDVVTTYDIKDRVASETRPDGGSTVIDYSVNGNQWVVTTTEHVKASDGSSDGTQVRREEYNVLRQLTKSTDGYGTGSDPFTTYTYDAKGYLEAVTVNGGAAGNATTTFDIDEEGNRLEVAGPNIGTVTSTYSAIGERLTTTDNKAQLTQYEYDTLGRLTSIVSPDGTSTWDWDTATNGIGKLASKSQNSDFVETYSYNSDSRLSSTVTSIVPIGGGSAVNYTTAYSYDSHGRPQTITHPGSGLVVTSQYNARGYLAALKDGITTIKSFDQTDAFGNTTQESYASGVSTSRVFDAGTGRLTDIDTTKSSTALQDNSYAWRSNGTLESRIARPAAGTADHREERFQYDVLNRLELAETYIDSVNTRDLHVAYDDLGNVKSHTSTLSGDDDVTSYAYGGSGAGPHAVSSAVVNGTTYTVEYDANGAVTKYDIGGTSNDKYLAYNAFNQPVKIVHGSSLTDTTPVAADAFAYDPDGDRYYRQTTWQDSGTVQEDVAYVGDVEVITDNLGNLIDTIYKTRIGENVMHVQVEGTDPVTLEPTTTTFYEYAHRDHLGSIEVVTDDAGNVVDHLAFEPFGGRKSKDWSRNAPASEIDALLTRSTGHPPKVRGFTGHEHLDRTGFIHMNGRLYDPLLSRFLSPDPIVQAPSHSQSWNRYSYVFNAPTSLIDPSGFVTVDDGGFLFFEFEFGTFWGSVDYYDPVQATNGGPLYVPADADFGASRYQNENLDAELDESFVAEGLEAVWGFVIGDAIETARETYGNIREGNFGRAAIGIAGLGCDLAKACKVLGKVGGRAIGAVRKRLGRSPDVPNRGLGDLTKGEVKQIQGVVDEAGRPLEVVGSAASGTRRGVGTDLPIGKGTGTRSDIDVLVPPSSRQHFEGLENNLPSLDPKSGIIPGTHNPHIGPAIRFEPGANPRLIPGAGGG